MPSGAEQSAPPICLRHAWLADADVENVTDVTDGATGVAGEVVTGAADVVTFDSKV